MAKDANKPSETITENIFREYYGTQTFIEKSAIPSEYEFKSKKENSDNKGYPDFFLKQQQYVIVCEAKASNHRHAISDIKFYMTNNNIMSDIIGIAISGQNKNNLKVSYFLRLLDNKSIISLEADNALLSLENIQRLYNQSKTTEVTTPEYLNKYLQNLNQQFQNENIVRDTDRSLFFSGLMIALKDPTFRKTYRNIESPTEEEEKESKSKMLEAHNLNNAIVDAITRQLSSKINNHSKEYNWKDKFSFIKTISYSLQKYKHIIASIEANVFLPFEKDEKRDILGQAYKIFLSKAGKVDNKNIILTPDHIRSLMIKLARLSVDDVVLDTCTGSGAFLMEAMEIMIRLANNNDEKIQKIQEEQLIGFEIDPVLFALACSNMFLHGDGRTNLIFRSSLINDKHDTLVDGNDVELFNYIKTLKPNRVIINPPYENNKPIAFVQQAINYLEKDGILIVIMPTNTLTANQRRSKTGELSSTETLLSNARLDFVIRMPERLFSEQNRTVNTSIFGFTKKTNGHDKNDAVLYYNLSDDGFVSIQHKGKIDKNKTWEQKEQEVLYAVNNKVEIQGISNKRLIYQENILNCAGFRKRKDSNHTTKLIIELFNVEPGTIASEKCDESGEYDFITASSEWKKHNIYTHQCEALIIAVKASGSLGRTHYVNGKFAASNLCLILTPKIKDINLLFYKYYFNSIRDQLKGDLATGASKLTINKDDFEQYYIDYIPFDEQNRFADKYIVPYRKLQIQANQTKQAIDKNIVKLIGGN